MVEVFTKTNLMKLVEIKHSKPILDIIFEGTIDAVGAKYNIDRSTVSKWRKRISAEIEDGKAMKFFKQFEDIT